MLHHIRLPLAIAIILLAASPLQAAQHVVRIMGKGYFPMVAYIESGDTVLFVNQSSVSGEIVAADGSWRSGELAKGEGFVLTPSVSTQGSFKFTRNGAATGTLSFSNAPMQ